jgi:hypothetical protein
LPGDLGLGGFLEGFIDGGAIDFINLTKIMSDRNAWNE